MDFRIELKVRGNYDVIVIGGGHAGLEAARAAVRALNGRGTVALLTMDEAGIGRMSCNPAIGGLAKGQIVREIDALGGLMGLAADASGIMFKMLNTSKGHAVRGPRAQCDKDDSEQDQYGEPTSIEISCATPEMSDLNVAKAKLTDFN